MLWTLIYIIIAQGEVGPSEVELWHTDLRFQTQQECTQAANDAAPGLMRAASTDVSPSRGGPGPNPNAVTLRPACVPVAK